MPPLHAQAMSAMFQIRLPDGSVKPMPEGSTPADVAAAIGPGLAKAALAARVDGEVRDLHRPFEGDAELALIIVPVLVVVLLTNVAESYIGVSGYAFAIVIFLVASFTDILDGHLARRRNQVSTLGKFLDPIADKLLVSAVLIVLVEKHLAPSWAVVIMCWNSWMNVGARRSIA